MNSIHKLPVPSTAILGSGPIFEIAAKRLCVISFCYEEGNIEVTMKMHFRGVQAFKCTYLFACSEDMLGAYDNVVDMGQSEWLLDAQKNLQRHQRKEISLTHLRVMFDDGPCYEFLCESFEALKLSGSPID